MKKFASIVSMIGTSPVWVLLWLAILALVFRSKFTLHNQDLLGIALLGIWTFVVGMTLRSRLNLDSKDRKYRSYLILSIISGWSLISLVFWDNFSWFLQEALTIAIFITTTLLVNNVLYRISFHVSLSTSLLILVNHFSSWIFWPLFLVVPLIGWSRLYLKKHTLLQVIAGFVVPFIVYFLLQYLGFLK